MNLPLNHNLIRVFEQSVKSMESEIHSLVYRESDHYNAQDSVGECLRKNVEQMHQDIAVLESIVARYKKELK